jgi:hypothetical protein
VRPAADAGPSHSGREQPPGTASGTLVSSIESSQPGVGAPDAGLAGHMIQRDGPAQDLNLTADASGQRPQHPAWNAHVTALPEPGSGG